MKIEDLYSVNRFNIIPVYKLKVGQRFDFSAFYEKHTCENLLFCLKDIKEDGIKINYNNGNDLQDWCVVDKSLMKYLVRYEN